MFSGTLLMRIHQRKTAMVINCLRRELLIRNLEFLHSACVASEQLLLDAAGVADSLPRTPFNKKLSEYYHSHFEEEKGEISILVEDLAWAGVPPPPPCEFAMGMIGTQYYLIKHVHPSALLGYMAVQEADPTPVEVVEKFERLHGKDLFRFLRLHAIKDLEHRKELLYLINDTPIEFHDLITQSAENSLCYYAAAINTWYVPDQNSVPIGERPVPEFAII